MRIARTNCSIRFGRTRVFTYDYILIDRYPTIDEAVRKVIASGIKQEEYEKSVNKKWEEWNKETD
jgi:hypothetical protein